LRDQASLIYSGASELLFRLRPKRQGLGLETLFCDYDYDARGNWVMKTVESRSGTGNDFTVLTVERRTIGYFE
jgi:hypothetical protein